MGVRLCALTHVRTHLVGMVAEKQNDEILVWCFVMYFAGNAILKKSVEAGSGSPCDHEIVFFKERITTVKSSL